MRTIGGGTSMKRRPAWGPLGGVLLGWFRSRFRLRFDSIAIAHDERAPARGMERDERPRSAGTAHGPLYPFITQVARISKLQRGLSSMNITSYEIPGGDSPWLVERFVRRVV